MKYKNRLVAFVICLFTFSVLYIISGEPKSRPELSRDDSRPDRPMRPFGYLQDKIQEIVGIRKVKKHPELLLKDASEIRARLMSDRSDNEAIKNHGGDYFKNDGKESFSDQEFETAIRDKFRRTDDNRQAKEVDGRTVMHDESVERYQIIQ